MIFDHPWTDYFWSVDFFMEQQQVLQLLSLVSFGLVVLIWLVQLIIYPNFQYLSNSKRIQWHRFYTPRITIIVAPLMILQLITATYLLFLDLTLLNSFATLLIVLNWLITFIYFVPLHAKIDSNNIDQGSLKSLVHVNWYRTVLWSCIFLIVLTEYLT